MTLFDGSCYSMPFQMPAVATLVSRKSSITNAFVNTLIPQITPALDEIEEALAILGMDASDVQCAYCGDKMTEWDHLRPLVVEQRPTGYISEIANLVPACNKCNQSKGNTGWRKWMLSKKARHSPTKARQDRRRRPHESLGEVRTLADASENRSLKQFSEQRNGRRTGVPGRS